MALQVIRKCLVFLTMLVAACASDVATAGSTNSSSLVPRIKVFNVLSMANESLASASGSGSTSAAASIVSVVKEAASDFILISELGGNSMAGSQLGKIYQATSQNQFLYNSARWKLIEDGGFHEAFQCVWGRFQEASEATNASACLVIADWNPNWTSAPAVDLLAYIQSVCDDSNVVALTLTTAASDSAAQYMEGITSVNDTYTPLRMVELSYALHEQQYLSPSSVSISNIPVAASNRMFFHWEDTMCADKVAAALGTTTEAKSVGKAAEVDAIALELCTGSNCRTCKPSHDLDDEVEVDQGVSGSSLGKNVLIVLLSCFGFLLTSTALFYLLTRNHFFATLPPPETTKNDDKELTSNIAYVLRI
uniref:Uncharacterized protein n=1 Tax=Globisporangium ultimum (strain ATCC 200006 / CBS 805.95 / DAOM BR144) TaxID=431595 RepID=K3WQF3_GLOUD